MCLLATDDSYISVVRRTVFSKLQLTQIRNQELLNVICLLFSNILLEIASSLRPYRPTG